MTGLLRSAAAVLAVIGWAFGAAPGAQAQTPLLMGETSTVYQRVLTRPAAGLYDAPGGRALDAYAAFQPFYVFQRQDGWVQVGPSAARPPIGWMKDDQVVDWKHNIIAAFTNPAGRSRQLVIDTEDDLRALMAEENLAAIEERLVAEASAGTVDGQFGVVSVEPAEYVNIRDSLYVMPILDFVEDLHPLNYEDILLMQIASINKDEERLPVEHPVDEDDQFDVGIVFVLDTTSSMRNYIERTRKVLQDTVRQIAGTDIGGLVNFGVVGFRDNVDAVPEIGYRTKILADLKRRTDETEVLNALAEATEVTTVSTPGFNEDSLAGVEDAIDLIDWDQLKTNGDPINARYVILVTDAGPKDVRDPNARSAISALELQAEAEDRNIALMSLHLKTPGGSGTHDYAAGAYRQLSRFAGREFYFPIEGGSEQAFEGVANRLVTAITDHVRTLQGEEAVLDESEVDENLKGLFKAAELAWLGAKTGAKAPDVITGWVSDKAIEAPQTLAFEPRLLVSKNEMATMAEVLDRLIGLAEQSRGADDMQTFFGQVQGVIQQAVTDPQRLAEVNDQTVGRSLEYLTRLPYKSQILQLTEDRWLQSAMMRRGIIDGMRQKLTQYRKWLFDPSAWTEPYEGAPDGEYVFAMPFEVLP
ncbi:vWA domain-containing protein [Chachezhania sediminis]|uniref:vWA domain-containing protein n=1 Tax=Chachezhania sediminis TaxID=2599291 RepID=UPI00131A7FBA|nr:vWA domain-containing protein [Chachezhania sediminis]